jgi:hypothetical protein
MIANNRGILPVELHLQPSNFTIKMNRAINNKGKGWASIICVYLCLIESKEYMNV